MIEKVILVFKTHFDIGFTDLASNVIAEYATSMLDRVVETCRATEQMGDQKYVWTMPAWPLYEVDRVCDGARRKALEYYIENGQIVWHALAFTSHTDFCGEEEYLESLRYGKRLCEKYGKPYPISAKMTDVPGHGFMLPEILGASGVQFLHLGCNAFATPPDVPLLFFWEAPSGRRVLTMYSKGGYGSGLQAPKDWPFPVWMAIMNTKDNSGPQSAEYIRSLIAQAQSLYPHAKILCGTMDHFARELEKNDLSALPVVKKDLADTWIHGIGAYPRQTGMIRALRDTGAGMQKYAVHRTLTGNGPAEQLNLDAFYENMHLFGEHTWGADVKTWLGPDRVYEKDAFLQAKRQESCQFMEKSWAEQKERAEKCEKELTEQLDKAHGAYRYNPSAVPFRGWTACEKGTETIFGRKSGFVSELAPFSTMPEEQLELPDVQDLTVRRSRDGSYVENHRYRLEFDPDSGEIFRLSDRTNGRILMKKRGNISVFAYRYHRYGAERMTAFLRAYGYRFPAWGVQDYGREHYPECEDESCAPSFDGCRIQGSSIIFSYRGDDSVQKYGDAARVEIEITLPSLGEDLFVEVKLLNKQETPFIESGCFCMPIAAENPQYLINKNGTMIDPERDIIRNANHVYYALERCAAAREGDHGVSVQALDTPLLSLGEDGCYLYRREYEKHKPVFCFNLFNNMWGTNFPQWIGGSFSYRYIIRSYDTDQEAKLLETAGMRSAGVMQADEPLPPLFIAIPKGMELLNMKAEGSGFLLITRDVSGTESFEYLSLPGFRISETDYYGRCTGDDSENRLGFVRKRYGLHLFFIEKRDMNYSGIDS